VELPGFPFLEFEEGTAFGARESCEKSGDIVGIATAGRSLRIPIMSGGGGLRGAFYGTAARREKRCREQAASEENN
jgi:hypothetical protein